MNHKVYDDLFKKGIIYYESMLKWQNGTTEQCNQLKIIALDYLKKTNQSNFKILLYDELFYAYLVWSLRDYTILYYQGFLQEKYNLLFNMGSYVDDRKWGKDGIEKQILKAITSTSIYDTLNEMDDLILENRFCSIAYRNASEGFFYIEPSNYFFIDSKDIDVILKFFNLIGYEETYTQISPNQNLFTRGQPITPSPLGKYYFELSDNKGVFIEFFDRIYPSITNPPKGWSKEMMQKLDLGLE